MNSFLETLAFILLLVFVVASCSDSGLQGEINGKPFCLKLGGHCSKENK